MVKLSSRSPLWDLLVFWRSWVVIFTPFILLPLAVVIDTTEAKCGYAILVMAVYWVTEALPLPVTALMPMILFPMLGVLPAKEVAVNYIKDTNLVFMGGLMLAVSIEHSNLHKRIAMRVLLFMGTRPRWLLLGFMLPTWFLSMWISNTATAAMMVPVAEAVLQQLRQGMTEHLNRKISSQGVENYAVTNVDADDEAPNANGGHISDYDNNTQTDLSENGVQLQSFKSISDDEKNEDAGGSTPKDIESNTYPQQHKYEVELAALNEKMKSMAKMLCLAVAYSANIGGMATLTGTPPNLVLDNVAGEVFSRHGVENPISFATWLPFGLPSSVICLLIAWVWLQILFMGKAFLGLQSEDEKAGEDESQEGIAAVVKEEYESLGPIRFAEGLNLILFGLLVILWFFRGPGFMTGYDSWFKVGKVNYVSDSVPAMLIGILLFALPSQMPKFFCLRKPGEKCESVPALLDWYTLSTRMPWGPIFILGGGFAIATATAKSGLSAYLGEQLSGLQDLPTWGIVMIVSLLIASLTEIASNTAIANITLPILAALAENIQLNPLVLMLPATLSASFAFMLPVATPPNAIVFAYGHISVLDMVKTGFALNIVCILVNTLATMTWAWAFFDLGTFPFNVDATTISSSMNLTSI